MAVFVSVPQRLALVAQHQVDRLAIASSPDVVERFHRQVLVAKGLPALPAEHVMQIVVVARPNLCRCSISSNRIHHLPPHQWPAALS